ncbi:MAG: hypothetical protein K6G84_07190 [Lachnospiraceae bacterium]|nr:hypothetical protein [Lachnospiraceae bacterium]
MKFYESTSADIMERIKQLAASYIPEWVLDEKNPDTSAAIAHIFADFMGQEINYFNLYPDRFHIEFVNMYGIAQKGAYPAHSVVSFSSGVSNADVKVPVGTELVAAPGEEDTEQVSDIIFRTLHDIAITDVSVKRILSVSGKHSSIVDISDDGENILFGHKGTNLYKNALVLDIGEAYAKSTEPIRLKFAGNMDSNTLASILSGGRFKFAFRSGDKLFDAVSVRRAGEFIDVYRSPETLCRELAIYSLRDSGYELAISEIYIVPSDRSGRPECILNDNTELIADEFEPFGNKLEEFSECFICSDEMFSHGGASADIRFDLEFGVNVFSTEAPVRQGRLPLVKRMEKENPYERIMSDSYAQEISFEYFNGIGWKALETTESVRGIFSKDSAVGNKIISFKIPMDWQKSTEGGYEGRTIRIRVKRSDNCYIAPCTHHYPILKNFYLSYTYEGRMHKPEAVYTETNNSCNDITPRLWGVEAIPVFPEFPYKSNEVFIELSGKLRKGPIGIFFELADNVRSEGSPISFSYSSHKGFKPLYVIDSTDGFTKSGTILFSPPTDMASVDLFGEQNCYIRMTDVMGKYDRDKVAHPRLNQLFMNSVEVANIEELAPASFYIDEIRHNASFELSAGNILDADVWVNELGDITYSEMNSLIESNSANARAVYDIRGEVSEFYVKWKEVESFEDCDQGDGRVYTLDRVNNRILFGNGINQKIPKNTDNTAFTVTLRISSGEHANVASDSITSFRRNVLFVDSIDNPIAAYGGTPLESVQKACRRAAGIIGSRGRLVTEEDVINEALAFSDNINQAACIFEDGNMELVLLMNDYLNGPFSIRMIKSEMTAHFNNILPITVGKNHFEIVEPLFVRINIDLWLVPIEKGREFEIEAYWLKRIGDFLNPIIGESTGGWQIGTLPSDKQFAMLFNDTENLSVINHYQITAEYTDESGIHRCELAKLHGEKRVIPVNGTHNIHMEWE